MRSREEKIKIVNEIENQIKCSEQIKKEAIGEAYCIVPCAIFPTEYRFYKFTKENILDRIEENIKLRVWSFDSFVEVWVKKENIIFYDDIYNNQRIEIIERIEKEKTNDK